MPKTWVFPFGYYYYSKEDVEKWFKKGNVLSWILAINSDYDNFKGVLEAANCEYTGLLEKGDEVYFWSGRNELKEEDGFFGFGLVVEKPGVFPFEGIIGKFFRNKQFEVFPDWARKCDEGIEPFIYDKSKMNGVYYHRRFRVGIEVIANFKNIEFIHKRRIEEDQYLSSLIQLLRDDNTHLLLSEEQANRLKVLSEKEVFGNKTLGGQGFSQDPQFIRAVELHAVELAKTHYLKNEYVVTDTGNYESYDLSCVKDGVERRVEVKGSTTKSLTIILTRAEVEHVRKKITPVDLVLVSEIDINRGIDGPKASGGNLRIVENWMPLDENLTVRTYDYKIP